MGTPHSRICNHLIIDTTIKYECRYGTDYEITSDGGGNNIDTYSRALLTFYCWNCVQHTDL